MSDKFFFKGRQNARKDHSEAGYTAKGVLKTGSKKYPLQLTVESEQRREEVAALVAEHALFADIKVIAAEGDNQENIAELTALINRSDTVTVNKKPNRNEPCSCGSGKKYKKCCG
ncbi:MAG: PBPRA1643 family SWIM/SEC-C metal-binding motif protein [Halioglobus sp.]